MPCFITGSAEGDRELYHNEEMTELTRMLCESLKTLEKLGGKDAIPESAREWWKNHKAIDAKRKGPRRTKRAG